MSNCLRFLSVCLIAALFSIPANAQTTTVKGTVKSSTSKESVPAVSVTIKGSDQGTFTNDNGNFSISTSAKLPLTLIFSSVGFEAKEVNVSDAGKSVDVDLTTASTLGQDVVVAATRTSQRILESPVTIERLGSLALRNVAAPNYYEAIANLKGVDMHTASLNFRTVTTRGFLGSGNTRFNQLIDGMDNQAPGLNFSVGNMIGLTELDVDNMELLPGASSALYGSGGMNGTLLINSKNPFKYQGLSLNVKQGFMHRGVPNSNGKSPYYDWTFRWAKIFNDKFAVKISGQLVKANDWAANDISNVSRTGVISKVIPGTPSTDPNYDGVNVYGDETSANINLITQSIQEAYRAGIQAATGGAIPNIVALLNAIIPATATPAQVNGILGAAMPAALLPTINAMFPFYWGLRSGWVAPTQSVARTGYQEKDLVDYGNTSFKMNASLHYKITPGIEAFWTTYFGNGTTVYTGADRYSLRNFKMAQHKLEFKHKNWFVRGYTTQENAGESYNATILGRLMQEAFKPSTTWYPQYIGNYLGLKYATWSATGGASTGADLAAHGFARSQADLLRPVPGTPAFDVMKTTVRKTAIPRGAMFLDESDLYAFDGQLNFSDAFGFSETVQVIAGGNWKQNVLNSHGTIFSDTAGTIAIKEVGGFVQLKKDLGSKFTLSAAGRYDKHQNFEGKFTPRVTAVYHAGVNSNLRLSYQTAYRFPTNQNQYINLNVGSGILIGCVEEFQTYYNLKANPGYTTASVLAARTTLDPSKLKAGTHSVVKPESVSSIELGYKGLLSKKILVDLSYYVSTYTDFLTSVAVVQSATGTAADVLNPFTSRNFSYTQNSTAEVKASGWAVGMDIQLGKGYLFSGNIYSDQLSNLPDGFISYFNTPKLRWNTSLRNDNVYKNIGFNIVAKHQGENKYEGTFIAGTLPAFTWVDAQVSYRIPKNKSVFRIGGTNIMNKLNRTGYGSPYIGRLVYVSYGYNIF